MKQAEAVRKDSDAIVHELRHIRSVSRTEAQPETAADVFVAGIGTVGSELLNQLHSESRLAADFRVVGFCNSKLVLFNKDGVSDCSFVNPASSGAPVRPVRWQHLTECLVRHRAETGRELIFIDATGDREPALLYTKFLDAGIHVVTPSKLANTMPQEYFDKLVLKRENGAQYRYEAAAGAGLPVVSTIETMVQNGDVIYEISGVLSGTMTYLFARLEQGVPFSEAVRCAHREGYTEPDPRDDLSGEDVARKCLLLARTAGFRFERSSFTAENQTPDKLRKTSLEEFFEKLPEYDDIMSRKVEEARKDGKVLRYTGRVTSGGIRVGTEAVPADSVLGGLSGADNLVRIRSRYYNSSPVTIQGPGAGSQVTAQGVLADMRRILVGV